MGPVASGGPLGLATPRDELGGVLPHPAGVRSELSRTASALFYGLVGNVRTERQIALVMEVSVLGGVGIALLGLLTSDWHTNKLPFLAPIYSHLPRISLPAFLAGSADPQAGLFHPNMIGGALALLIPFDVALLG